MPRGQRTHATNCYRSARSSWPRGRSSVGRCRKNRPSRRSVNIVRKQTGPGDDTLRAFREGREHVFFPGGYKSVVLNDRDRLYRSCVPIFADRTIEHVRIMAEALESVDQPDSHLPLLPKDIERLRRARALCLSVVSRGNLHWANRLIDFVLDLLTEAARSADYGEALENRRARAAQSARGSAGAETKWAARREALGTIFTKFAKRKDELG